MLFRSGTGCIARVSNGGATVKDYTVVLFGDANGDGKINAIDLTTINWHLLKKKAIAGGFLSASDVNHDDKANAIDLATIVRHILHKLTISQN